MLRALPMEAVVELSILLDQREIGQQDELRIFLCLAMKFIQHEDDLPATQRAQAIQTLLRKMQANSDASRPRKVRALKSAKSSLILQRLKQIQDETQ